MRVMISQPTEEMGEEQVGARGQVIAELEAQGHEIWGELPNRVLAPKEVNEELWQLGHRLQDMAGADAVYFMDGWEKDRRCRLEYEVAAAYGIKILPDERISLAIFAGHLAGSVYALQAFTDSGFYP